LRRQRHHAPDGQVWLAAMRKAWVKACRERGRRVGFQSRQALGLSPDDPKASKAEQIIIQVKGGKTGVKNVLDLRGVLDRERAAMGVLISLQPPTRDMVAEGVSAGFYEHKTIQGEKRTGIAGLWKADGGTCAARAP
jgi:hypothetical protein